MREKTLVEAVASSLTELFAPKIHKERISGMLENYDFISDDVMAYFKRRLTRRRATPTSPWTTSSATRARPRRRTPCSMRCRFKCNVLWAQLDALHVRLCRAGHDPARRVRAGQSMNEDPRPLHV